MTAVGVRLAEFGTLAGRSQHVFLGPRASIDSRARRATGESVRDSGRAHSEHIPPRSAVVERNVPQRLHVTMHRDTLRLPPSLGVPGAILAGSAHNLESSRHVNVWYGPPVRILVYNIIIVFASSSPVSRSTISSSMSQPLLFCRRVLPPLAQHMADIRNLIMAFTLCTTRPVPRRMRIQGRGRWRIPCRDPSFAGVGDNADAVQHGGHG